MSQVYGGKKGMCAEGGKHEKLLTMNKSSAVLEAEETGSFHL